MQQLLDTLINGPSRYLVAQNFDPIVTLVLALVVFFLEVAIIWGCMHLLFKGLQYLRTLFSAFLRHIGVGKQDIEYAFLQLVFPSDTKKSAYATEQLHMLLRSTVKYPRFWQRQAAKKQPYSLELVATRDDGIRYILVIPKQEVEVARRTLLSYLPGLKMSEIDDYLSDVAHIPRRVAEVKLAGDFVLPLADHKTISEHDPIAYLTGHMRNLLVDELAAFQVVAVPVLTNTHPNELRHVRGISHRIALNKEINSKLTAHKIDSARMLLWVATIPLHMVVLPFKVFAWVLDVFLGDLPSNQTTDGLQATNPYQRELSRAVKTKLDQPLFEVSIRILVASSDKKAAVARINAILSSLHTFTETDQAIGSRKFSAFSSADKWLAKFQNRSLTRHIFSQQTILSSSELSNLYHFPNTDLTKTEGLVKSRSRNLPTPLSIKRSDTKLDVIIGANEFDGEMHDIGITLEQRQRHTYVLGKTGTGKTTLLMSSIYQDMVNGKGLAVLDPHGDMFYELLQIIPENRRKDVVVFDPSDGDFPVGFNILDPGIDFSNEDDKHEWVTSTVLSVFRKLADEKQWGPRMEHILRNTTLTALQLPNPSLYTLQRLLTDKKYQKDVAKTLKDPVLKQFWDKEFKMMGSMQMSAATAPLTHRLGQFITSKRSRHILLQDKSTIRIADIMNEGKILLVNLSKGKIGEDQSMFFGTILTSFIWMAAYQRIEIPIKKRRDFFVYVDEFQNFATPQFGAITSEGRKFRVSLVVSHQNIAQMEDKDLVKVIAGNAATIICLKANPEDEAFILPYMKPEVQKGDIVNLAPYHFYAKISGDGSEDAFSGQTVPLDIEELSEVAEEVAAHSRRRYATLKSVIEAEMDTLFTTTRSTAVGVTVNRKSVETDKTGSGNMYSL
jgi:type IV secretory pathway TraG/TraD family ATPase VirD4